MDEKIVGLRVKLLREKKDLSQAKMAKELGISQPVVAKYEQGIIYPSYPILIAYADYFNVSTDYLLGRTDNKESPLAEDTTAKEKEIDAWVEMCFDPSTTVNARLKEMLREMLKGGR